MSGSASCELYRRAYELERTEDRYCRKRVLYVSFLPVFFVLWTSSWIYFCPKVCTDRASAVGSDLGQKLNFAPLTVILRHSL